MNSFCCFIGLAIVALGINAQSNDSTIPLPTITEICVANIDQTIDYSNNYGGWIEIYNPTDKDITLDGWHISDEAEMPAKHKLSGYGVLSPNQYQCVFFDHNAADGVYGPDASKQVRFKLDRNGGTLYFSANGTDVDFSVTYPASVPRCSYARVDLTGNEWQYCGLPTPGAANAGHYAQMRLDAPQVDYDSRLFTSGFNVQVNIPSGTTLRYTLDGSTPTLANGETSTDGRFNISQTTVLRLRLFADGFLPSGVVTRTYIYKDWDYYLPIVAIATDPRNLYDNWIGCYVNGKNGIIDRGSTVKSNLNMDWERPVNFEYLTADGKMILNQEAGFEVMGGYSRHFNPASFKVKAKKLYDDNGDFGNPVFAGKPYCKYKQLIIRNGGNNNRTDGGPRIKDAITQQVLTSSGYYVDAQEYQPAHVFINGRYLAMMNVREPNNRFHGCANYGYDDDTMDGFEYSGGGYHQKGGDREAFDRLIALSENAGTETGYAEVCGLLDMEEFVRYMAVICYTGSSDWLLNGNNVKGYRTQEDGKFHFVLFDQDVTWERTDNVVAVEGVTKNEVLVLYNNLKRSKDFCRQFVTSYCILHGSVYTPQRCQAVADSICSLVEKALSLENRQASRTYNKMQKEMWGEDFRNARIQSLANAYNLGEGMFVTVNTNSAKACIHMEGQALPSNNFSGLLFGAVRLRAETAEGYAFLGWKGSDGQWLSREKECIIEEGGTYTAVYETALRADISPVCINEISAANDIFVNDYGKRADWIELYNRGDKPVHMAGMYFSDDPSEPTKYRLEAVWGVNTTIKPNGRMVIWCDGKSSLTQPHLPFKLKNTDGGFLSIQSADGKWKDTIRYDVHSSKESIGRYPDGGCSYYTFYRPTIGTQNMNTMYDTFVGTIPGMGISNLSSDDIVSVAYYTLDGKRTEPQNGIYIKVVYYRNGHSSASKIMVKNGVPDKRH